MFDDTVAQRDDDAIVFCHRNKLGRRDSAANRMVPARQGLDPGNGASLGINDGLELQVEIVCLNRFDQIIRQFTLPAHARLEALRILFPVPASARLGGIERQIRFLDNCAGILGVRINPAQADAGAALNVCIGITVRQLQGRRQIVDEIVQPSVRMRPRDQQGELVAAIARQQIHWLAEGLQPFRNQFQDFVAAAMTKRVIDPFEIVQVDPDQRAFIGVANLAFQMRRDRGRERVSVQQSCDGIILGQEGRALLA